MPPGTRGDRRFTAVSSLDSRPDYPLSGIIKTNLVLIIESPPTACQDEIENHFQFSSKSDPCTRFPANLTLNLHLEKRFRLLGGQWALRAGFNNLTGLSNPTAVDNNIDSPNFLTYGGVQGRAFTGRIRFLGRQ